MQPTTATDKKRRDAPTCRYVMKGLLFFFFEVPFSGNARPTVPAIGGSVARQPVSGTGIGRRRTQGTIMQMRSAVRCHKTQLRLAKGK